MRTGAVLMLAALTAATPACRRAPEPGQPAASPQEDQIIARVEGERVAAGLFTAYLRDNLNVADDPPPGEGGVRSGVEAAQAEAMSDEVKSRLLDRFLLEQALFVRARGAGVEVSDEELDKFSMSVGLGPLATLHEGAPFTEREYLRKYLANCLVVKRYLDREVLAAVVASEAEGLEYYSKNAAKFSRPNRYRLRMIRVDTLAEAQALARDIGKDSASFLRIAQNLSGGVEGEGDQGKDLGVWSAEDLPEPFAVALAPLAKGQISGVVQDPDGGFNLIYVEDRIEGGTSSFDAVKATVLQKVTRDKRDQRLAAFLAEVREKSRIEIDESSLDFHYVARATAQTGPAPATSPASPGGPS